MNVITKPFWFASVYHGPNDDGFILEKQKKEYFCKEGGMRIIIPINTKKKALKYCAQFQNFFGLLILHKKMLVIYLSLQEAH